MWRHDERRRASGPRADRWRRGRRVRAAAACGIRRVRRDRLADADGRVDGAGRAPRSRLPALSSFMASCGDDRGNWSASVRVRCDDDRLLRRGRGAGRGCDAGGAEAADPRGQSCDACRRGRRGRGGASRRVRCDPDGRRPTEFGAMFTLAADTIRVDGVERETAGAVRIAVGGTSAARRIGEWRAGRRVRVTATLAAPLPYLNIGTPNQETRLALAGIRLFGSVKSAAQVDLLARGRWWDEAAASVRAYVRRASPNTWEAPPGVRAADAAGHGSGSDRHRHPHRRSRRTGSGRRRTAAARGDVPRHCDLRRQHRHPDRPDPRPAAARRPVSAHLRLADALRRRPLRVRRRLRRLRRPRRARRHRLPLRARHRSPDAPAQRPRRRRRHHAGVGAARRSSMPASGSPVSPRSRSCCSPTPGRSSSRRAPSHHERTTGQGLDSISQRPASPHDSPSLSTSLSTSGATTSSQPAHRRNPLQHALAFSSARWRSGARPQPLACFSDCQRTRTWAYASFAGEPPRRSRDRSACGDGRGGSGPAASDGVRVFSSVDRWTAS